MIGHSLVEFFIIGMLVLGLGQFLSQPAVFSFIGILGGGLLLWMAFGLLRTARSPLAMSAAESLSNRGLVFTGAMASISNPYFLMWWGTVGIAALALSQRSGVIGLISFFTGHISADFIWYTAITAGVSLGRRSLGERLHRSLLYCCGMFLVVLAVYVSSVGITTFLGLPVSLTKQSR
jgi:threonine/homoserine/homoserine lactone efflux protein